MVKNVNNKKNLNTQKNRFFKKPKNNSLKLGEYGLFCKNEGRLELVQISKIKKFLKKFIRKKKSEIDVTREKIWYFGIPNFFIQKKSKNSRMGKGKGLIERKIIRVRKNFIIFEFIGVSKIKLFKLIVFCNKFLNVKFSLKFNKVKTFSNWPKFNKFFTYYNKYITA